MAWRPKYKQLCAICKKNHVLISARGQFPICTSCSMRQINQPIADETFRKLFAIDQKLYEESSFLRSIKSNYLRFGSLSDKQIEVFKKVAAELNNPPAQAARVEETVAAVVEAEDDAATPGKEVAPEAEHKAAKPKSAAKKSPTLKAARRSTKPA